MKFPNPMLASRIAAVLGPLGYELEGNEGPSASSVQQRMAALDPAKAPMRFYLRPTGRRRCGMVDVALRDGALVADTEALTGMPGGDRNRIGRVLEALLNGP